MKKIIYIFILFPIVITIGCKSKEDIFLEKHHVIFYDTKEFEEFEKEAKIKKEEASLIRIKYCRDNNIHLIGRLFFIIDNHYVFTSYFHPKIPDASTKGTWIDSNTGNVKYISEGIFLKGAYKYFVPK